jgi:hypothetical protein
MGERFPGDVLVQVPLSRDIPDFPIHLDADLFRLIRETIAMRMQAIDLISDGKEVYESMGKTHQVALERLKTDEHFAAEVDMVASGVEAVLRLRSIDEKYIACNPVRFLQPEE